MIAVQRGFHISAQLFHAGIADRHPKVAAGHIFQFVSFVENDCTGLGKNARVGRIFRLLLDRQIGEEKMMVDDDDVALHRSAVHFCDETLVPGTAFLADAGIGACVELVPEHAGFGQHGKFGAVSGVGSFLPGSDGAVVLNFLKTA